MCLYLNENKMNYLQVKKTNKNWFGPIEAIYLYVKEQEIVTIHVSATIIKLHCIFVDLFSFLYNVIKEQQHLKGTIRSILSA